MLLKNYIVQSVPWTHKVITKLANPIAEMGTLPSPGQELAAESILYYIFGFAWYLQTLVRSRIDRKEGDSRNRMPFLCNGVRILFEMLKKTLGMNSSWQLHSSWHSKERDQSHGQ